MDWAKATDSILTLCRDTFGKTVSYTVSGGGGTVSIKGVFDAQHVAPSVGNGPESSMVAPALGIRLADLPRKPAKGDWVGIDGVSYRVIDSQEDGQGGAMLILHRA